MHAVRLEQYGGIKFQLYGMKFVGVKLLYDRFFDRVFYHTYDSVLIDLNIWYCSKSSDIREE